MKFLPLCATVVFILLAFAACTSSHKFTEGDIAKTETDIRSQFEKNGFTVEQVSLIEELTEDCPVP